MRLPALLVAALVLPVLAGCLGGGAGLTAKDAAGKALDRARSWQPDAFLIALGTVETRNTTAAAAASTGGLVAAADPDVGDGRSNAWGVFAGSARANATLALVVFGNGTILAHDGPAAEGAKELRNWDADSPRLGEALRARADLAPLLAASDAFLGAVVGNPGSNASDPVWTFFLGSGQLGHQARGIASGKNGEILSVDVAAFHSEAGLPPSSEGPSPQSFKFSGTVGPNQAEQKHPFAVGDGHSGLNVRLSAQPTIPGDDASWEVLDPTGAVAARSTGPGDTAVTSLAAGSYTLVVRFQPGPPSVPVPGIEGVRRVEYQAEVRVA